MRCQHGVEELEPRPGEPAGVFPCWFCLVPNGSPEKFVDIQHNPGLGLPAIRLTNPDYKPTRKSERISFLERKRKVTIEDCRLKLEGEDFHGVADAAMDLRDIDNELDGLRYE